jgi:hypothetical protein
MTTTLQSLNFETAKLPGLRVWGFPSPHWEGRVSIVVQNERGAVELWSAPTAPEVEAITHSNSIGGVEIHSPTQLYDFAAEPTSEACNVLDGNCWSDGSSLAYSDKFLPLIQAGNTTAILHALADWHESHFAAGTEGTPA